MIPHVEMPVDVPLRHLALGLTLICGSNGMKAAQLDELKDHFMKFNHDTIWPAAYETALQNGRLLTVAYLTLHQIAEMGNPDCMMLNMPGDRPVCACICGGTVMLPEQELCPENFQKIAVIYETDQTAVIH